MTKQEREQQRKRALEAANKVRRDRRDIKAEVKAGERSIVDLLTEVPSCIETAKIGDFVTWQPSIGKIKASRILARNNISPSRTIKSLSVGQKLKLLAALRMSLTRRGPVTSMSMGEGETRSTGSSPVASTT